MTLKPSCKNIPNILKYSKTSPICTIFVKAFFDILNQNLQTFEPL